MSPAFHSPMGAEQFDWANRPTGRSATPLEIAEVVAFVAVGRCAWLNGADIVVDGGFVAGLLTGWIDGSTAPARAQRGRSPM
jgi:NAD(P)-dependent dehydrogenase (short-subunit alcohol dehydrogenase family)